MALNTGDPNAVREATRAILAQSEYQHAKQTLWARVLFYISHPFSFLDLVFSWIVGEFLGSGAGTVVAWAITAVALAVGIYFVVHLQRSTSRNGSVRVHYAPAPSGKTVRELLSEADALEANEQWRDAVRVRYSAMILSLANQGVVRARAGRTTGEYEREVALGAPEAAATFTQATRIFEWVWYGNGTPSRDDAMEFRSLASSIEKEVAA